MQINWGDLVVAMEFWNATREKSMVLQVSAKDRVPYVRRVVQKMLGVASKQVDNEMWYGQRVIIIDTIDPSKTQQLSPESLVFFVSDDEMHREDVYSKLELADLTPKPFIFCTEAGVYPVEVQSMILDDLRPIFKDIGKDDSLVAALTACCY